MLATELAQLDSIDSDAYLELEEITSSVTAAPESYLKEATSRRTTEQDQSAAESVRAKSSALRIPAVPIGACTGTGIPDGYP